MRKTLILVAITALLAGCTQSPPLRHSYHYATHQTEMVSGNFVNNPRATAQMNLKIFEDLYNSGKSDRTTGVRETEALRKAAEIKTANMNAVKKSTFINSPQARADIEQSDPRDAKLWAEELSETYLDGYRGIQ